MNNTDINDVLFNPHLEELVNLTTTDSGTTPSTSDILIKIFYFLLCAMGACGNITIIYITFRLQRTQSLRSILIAHWATSDLCALIVFPAFVRLFSFEHIYIPIKMFRLLVAVEYAFKSNQLIFVIFLGIAWQFETYHLRMFSICKDYSRTVVATAWIISLSMLGIAGVVCNNNGTIKLIYIYFLLLYFAALLYVLFLNTYKIFKRNPNETSLVSLVLVTTLTLVWFPDIISIILEMPQVIYIISEVHILLDSVIVFCLLYKFDQNFQACFWQIFNHGGIAYREHSPPDL